MDCLFCQFLRPVFLIGKPLGSVENTDFSFVFYIRIAKKARSSALSYKYKKDKNQTCGFRLGTIHLTVTWTYLNLSADFTSFSSFLMLFCAKMIRMILNEVRNRPMPIEWVSSVMFPAAPLTVWAIQKL